MIPTQNDLNNQPVETHESNFRKIRVTLRNGVQIEFFGHMTVSSDNGKAYGYHACTPTTSKTGAPYFEPTEIVAVEWL